MSLRHARRSGARVSEPLASPTRTTKPPARERSLVLLPNEPGILPDLLHAEPAISVDEAAVQHALSFAFIAGSAGGSLSAALSRTAIAASSFTPDTLQDGLFLDELVAHTFDFTVAGKPAAIDRVQLRREFAPLPTPLFQRRAQRRGVYVAHHASHVLQLPAQRLVLAL